MKDLIGVVDSKLLILNPPLKQSFLLFERFAVPRFVQFWDRVLKKYEHEFDPALINDLAWLYERGILYEPNLEPSQAVFETKEFADSAKAAIESLEEFRALPYPNFSDPGELVAARERLAHYIFDHGVKESRYASIIIREQENCDAVPLIPFKADEAVIGPGESEVASIVINSLPIPSEQTSWENILEFQNDPDTREKLFRLRRWSAICLAIKYHLLKSQRTWNPCSTIMSNI